MENPDHISDSLPPIDALNKENIRQSKYMLNAAIAEVLKGRNPNDIAKVRATIFEILESQDPIYQKVKYSLLDGRFLDGAADLSYLAKRSPDLAGELFRQSAILYAPLLTWKSVEAFEQALDNSADLSRHHGQLARLYNKMGDQSASERYRSLHQKYLEENPKAELIVEAAKEEVDADNKVIALNLARKNRARF